MRRRGTHLADIFGMWICSCKIFNLIPGLGPNSAMIHSMVTHLSDRNRASALVTLPEFSAMDGLPLLSWSSTLQASTTMDGLPLLGWSSILSASTAIEACHYLVHLEHCYVFFKVTFPNASVLYEGQKSHHEFALQWTSSLSMMPPHTKLTQFPINFSATCQLTNDMFGRNVNQL